MSEFSKFSKLTIFTMGFFAFTGFLSSAALIVEKIQLLQYPKKALICDINPLVSCSTVMQSPYASIFGIPWALFGVAGYPAVMLLALFMYTQQGKIPKMVAHVVTLGSFGAFVLSTVFMFISAYLIISFCPWCLLSAISSTSVFFALLYINLRYQNFGSSSTFFEFLRGKFQQIHLIVTLFFWFFFLFIIMYAPFYLIQYNVSIFLK